MGKLTPPRRLWDHQIEAFRYARNEMHPALLMEMRLGKTLVTIRSIVDGESNMPTKGKNVLVIAPGSALGAWYDDLRNEGVDACRIHSLVGTKQQRERILSMGLAFSGTSNNWFLINKEGHRALPRIGTIPWDAVVLDEASTIKDPKTKFSKFCCKYFRNATRRFALTGTINPESELDLFQVFKFLDGHFGGFRNFYTFRDAHFHEFVYKWYPNKGVRSKIAFEVAKRAFVLRRKDVRLEQRRVYEQRWLEFPKQISREYDSMEKTFEKPDGTQTKSSGALFAWLRQLSNGFVDGECVWRGKVDEIVDLVTTELRDCSIVIWFEFNDPMTEVFARLRKEKVSCELIRGETTPSLRETHRRRFNNGATRVLLVQVKCATYGMNLSKSDTAIYFDRVPSGTERKQTEDRIMGIKKAEAGTPLLFIDLVTANSVDEDLYDLSVQKGIKQVSLQDGIRAIQERRKTNG